MKFKADDLDFIAGQKDTPDGKLTFITVFDVAVNYRYTVQRYMFGYEGKTYELNRITEKDGKVTYVGAIVGDEVECHEVALVEVTTYEWKRVNKKGEITYDSNNGI